MVLAPEPALYTTHAGFVAEHCWVILHACGAPLLYCSEFDSCCSSMYM
jgi:hypothetical protein